MEEVSKALTLENQQLRAVIDNLEKVSVTFCVSYDAFGDSVPDWSVCIVLAKQGFPSCLLLQFVVCRVVSFIRFHFL